MKSTSSSSGFSWKLLLIFSLLASNLVLYFFGYIAKDQMIYSTSQVHGKIFGRYELEVEKAGKQFSRGSMKDDGDDLSPKILSPQWIALKELKNIYPTIGFEIIPADFDTAEKPVGWNMTFEKDGWTQSVFVLNSKSKSLLKISNYTKDEYYVWRKSSFLIAAVTFVLFLSFGMLLLYNQNSESKNKSHEVLLRKVHLILVEIEYCIKQIKSLVSAIDKNSPQNTKKTVDEVIQLANQMKVLSVNGSIETFKKSIDSRLLENLFVEINNLSCKAQSKLAGDLMYPPVLDLQPLVEKFEDLHLLVEKTLDQSLAIPSSASDREAV